MCDKVLNFCCHLNHNVLLFIARKGLYFSLRARLNIMLFGCVRSTWYIWQFKTFEFDM